MNFVIQFIDRKIWQIKAKKIGLIEEKNQFTIYIFPQYF
jgi:hypothetical protein